MFKFDKGFFPCILGSLLLFLLSGCGEDSEETSGSGSNTSVVGDSGSSGTQDQTKITISTSNNQGGSITPQKVTVEKGESVTFTIAADNGYQIDTVSGCGGELNGNVYLIKKTTQTCAIRAFFALETSITNVHVSTQALSAELQAQPLFLVNSEYAKPLDEQTNNSMAVEATENQLLSLTDETGEPLLMGLKLANQSNAEVTLESSAVVFVLRSNQFYGANFSDRAELSRRIEAHDKFPLLVSELGDQLKNGNPCPMDRSCSAVAAIIAERIASSLSVDDLLVAGE
ncbi:TPA: hypothetical protein NVH30_000892 [Vibrio cholerae]|nr:hypothetical protein [Vibrio cholerae]HCJ7280389.1 hypothetical protein [Vibrio cholerae]HCJ7316292.1 hypothetical protein [Vibrio cholerae]